MVDWNPTFPDTFGLEWFPTRSSATPVYAGSPGRMQRLVSTTAETITALRLSGQVNPSVRGSVPTLIDVIEEGNEFVPAPTLARLSPSVDRTNDGWTRSDGSGTNLWQYIDDPTDKWPQHNQPADTQWIRTFTPATHYSCGVNTTLFQQGGAAENGRIFWVGVAGILSATTGDIRRLGVRLEINGVLYPPAGGHGRDVHGFGQIYEFYWGEINPSTSRPWTPAEIANFGTQANWGIRVNSAQVASASHHPRVHALSLNVTYSNTENRVAVGVWRRPENIGTNRLVTVTTDTLRALPSGTADWSKPSGVNHLYFWRQSSSPSEYGAVVADDVRWNGGYQDLGSGGKPPGIVYPLHYSGSPPPPSTSPASAYLVYDIYGRPWKGFVESSPTRAAFGIALVRSDAAMSTDSQPYRMDVTDIAFLNNASGTAGQRLTPPSSQTYIGVRLPVIPLGTGPGTATLTVRVHAVSGGAQVGGTFSITKTAVRSLPAGPSGLRYVTGFFSSPVPLTGGTQYEIRVTTDSVSGWHVYAPNCSLAPTASFGGSTSGAIVAGSHDTNRDFLVNLIKQPAAPTVGAAVTTHPVSRVTVCGVDEVQHVTVTGTPSAIGGFLRLELERQLDGGDWVPITHFNTEDPISYVDRLVPRGSEAAYRLRSVARDGRISAWATTTPVTPNATDAELIITSDHRPELELVFDYDPESSYPILSNERDEVVPIEGLPLQVVFMERVTRGIGWSTSIAINFGDTCPPELRGGARLLEPLLELVRADDIPYVVVLDHQGTRYLGYVELSDAKQEQPLDRYSAQINVIPTNVVEVPVEVD